MFNLGTRSAAEVPISILNSQFSILNFHTMALFDGLVQQLSGPVASMISKQLGADDNTTQQAIAGALPLLISALSKNASTDDGANALSNALDKDHDGGILDNLMGLISNPQASAGAGILGHLLGGNQGLAQQGVSQASGLNMAQAGQLLITLAPIVMGFLGKHKQEQGMDASTLAGFLGGQQQQAQSATPSGLGMLMNLVDMNHDGSPVDDVLGMLGKFF